MICDGLCCFRLATTLIYYMDADFFRKLHSSYFRRMFVIISLSVIVPVLWVLLFRVYFGFV